MTGREASADIGGELQGGNFGVGLGDVSISSRVGGWQQSPRTSMAYVKVSCCYTKTKIIHAGACTKAIIGV